MHTPSNNKLYFEKNDQKRILKFNNKTLFYRYRGYALGHTYCQIFAFIGSLSGIGAGMTNACIAYDR